MFHLDYAYITSANDRESNEDAVLIESRVYSGEQSGQGGLKDVLSTHFSVSDGVSGTSKRAHAGESLLDLLRKDILRVPLDHVGRRVSRLHDEYSSLGVKGSKYLGLCATIVGAEFAEDSVQVYNVGDSRGWLIRDNNIDLLTTDHTVKNELNVSKTTELSWIYSALSEYFAVDSNYARPKNTYTKFKVLKGDVLVLASDGISMLGEDLGAALYTGNPESYARLLYANAVKNGSDDNISIIVIDVK
jgi:protein phosphatase